MRKCIHDLSEQQMRLSVISLSCTRGNRAVVTGSVFRLVGLLIIGGSTAVFAKEKKTGQVTSSLPVFSPPVGAYYTNVPLQLSGVSGSAIIRYTLDRSEPGPHSPVYAGWIHL